MGLFQQADRILLGALLIALIGGLLLYLCVPHEPSYRGKAQSYWVNCSGQESPEDVSAALNAISKEAIPYLVDKLQWAPSPTMVHLQRQFPNFPLFLRCVQGASNPRGPAAHALGQFGPLATSAIPQLMMLSSNSDLPSSWYERGCAQAALIKIRQEPLAPYI